jgi:hypothetical protein
MLRKKESNCSQVVHVNDCNEEAMQNKDLAKQDLDNMSLGNSVC